MSGHSPRVAVIGAGISGVVTAGHLLEAGIEVTVFERNHAAGGVWLYDKRTPIEVQYPAARPSDAEQHVEDGRDKTERQFLLHAPPGPCYESLTNNVPTPLLRTKLNAWPEGTAPFVKHNVLREYIQNTSKKAGVDAVTLYGTRVTKVYKDGSTWQVRWSSLHNNTQTASLAEKQEASTFDSVVIASGHYHTPLIPDIPGLPDAKAKWPSRIFHSKSFRRSEGFEGKNVLLVGGGVSSLDIAREISPFVHQIHQSTRGGAFDFPSSALPANATRTSEIAALELLSSETVQENEHLALTIHLKSGETLPDIDQIILCTGYQMALPFLAEYNNHDLPVSEANESVLVTDGTQVHNLHRDIFYIPDPTLSFVGIPFYTATFTLFEFQAIAVAAFVSGVAQLPSTKAMRDEYTDRVKAKGYGRKFHSLREEERPYVKGLVDWVNAGRVARGFSLVEGHTPTWIQEKEAHLERLNQVLSGNTQTETRETRIEGPIEVDVAV